MSEQANSIFSVTKFLRGTVIFVCVPTDPIRVTFCLTTTCPGPLNHHVCVSVGLCLHISIDHSNDSPEACPQERKLDIFLVSLCTRNYEDFRWLSAVKLNGPFSRTKLQYRDYNNGTSARTKCTANNDLCLVCAVLSRAKALVVCLVRLR